MLILASLADGPKHGYAIMKDIESFPGNKIGPGTLYTAITRLVVKTDTGTAHRRAPATLSDYHYGDSVPGKPT